MPSTVNAIGRRKVRCPKCTALLTEPETQIYECPICLTLLLAKGNPGSKLWDNRGRNGGADDSQQMLEGGSKLEKATLVNESSKDQMKQSFENVEIESNIGLDGRSKASFVEGLVPAGLDYQSVSSESNALAPDTAPDSPHHRKSLHVGETLPPRGGSGHRLSELDSASRSGSEGDLDSPIWSSENANISEAPEVSSVVSSFEASSVVDGSSEHLSTSRSSLLSGAVRSDGAQSVQEESEFETRIPFDSMSIVKGAAEETKHDGRHHPHEGAHEERQFLEARIRNPNVPVIISSGKSVVEEGHKAKDKLDDEKTKSSDSMARSTGSKSPQSNPVDSKTKASVIGESKSERDKEVSQVGKFGLFDLSVFGIYNEDMYSELRRGKAAHYSRLSESGFDGDAVQAMTDGDLVSYSCEIAPESSSREQDSTGNHMIENIAQVQKSSDIPESSISGAQIEAGRYGEVPLKDQEQDIDARSSCSVSHKVDDVGNANGEEVGLLPNSSVDSDTLANVRYGDPFPLRDLSMEMVSSVDVSFGDWRSQQVVKPPQKSHEQTYVDAGSLYERGAVDLSAGEGSDSSWDDGEEVTFSSTLKELSKLEVTAEMGKQTPASLSTRRSIGRSRAKGRSENPAVPFRTTAMQKFLERNGQAGTVQALSQESIKADSKLYEAPYMDRYTPPEEGVHEAADQSTILTPLESSVDNMLYVKEDESVAEDLEDTHNEIIKRQHENLYSAQSTQTALAEGVQSRKDLATGDETVSRLLFSQKEIDAQTDAVEDPQSRKGFDPVKIPERDVRVDKMDQAGIQATDADLQNVDYFKHSRSNKVGSAPGKPVSLRWKGKGRSSTQSISSTEDDGAYGIESEAGSGPDRDSTKKQVDGLSFPDRDVQPGFPQQTRGPYQPVQRTWLGNINEDWQKHGSGELATSRRTARSRASNARLSNQESSERGNAVSIPNLGWDRSENVPAFQSQEVNLNRSMLDQGSHYSYNGLADYKIDHSSRSQHAPSHYPYNETYSSNVYGLSAAGKAQAYPLQTASYGSIPRGPLHEPGFNHSAHDCVSPASSLCMQQHYMQMPQMLENVLVQPCAVCASQSSAPGYHHHGVHSHHMHGLTYSNPSLRQQDSGSPPVQSRRQNRSKFRPGHPLPLARRPKLYPPLPGKDAPPYVLCKHCNLLLQVPGYLSPLSGPIQKLQCGSCEKFSKFSVLQAVSPPANPTVWATSGGLATHASDSDNLLARDKQHMDTSSIHSSDRVSLPQNSRGTAWHTPEHGSQQEWAENRFFLQSSGSGVPQRHHPRPTTGGVPEQYKSYGRHVKGEHVRNTNGVYSEGYLSSSPASPASSSPRRPPQRSEQHQRVEPVQKRIPGFGEMKLSPDSLALSIAMHEQAKPAFEALNFSDSSLEKVPSGKGSRFPSANLQGSGRNPYSGSPRNEHFNILQQASKAGSWHDQPADADYKGKFALRSRMEQPHKFPAAPGSPLIEYLNHDTEDFSPTLTREHVVQSSGNVSDSVPWSPALETPLSPPVDSYTQDSLTDVSEQSRERERPPLPVQDTNKGSKTFAGLFKRSMKDFGKGGQGGNRRKVVVNGRLIPESGVRRAEELAGPIHSGSYWYDYQAGFWGVMGGPCLGILMPFIEDFHSPLARDCAGGTTGILVNGRELHEKDLEVLAKRGMPTMSGKAYILDISGALFDDVTGQPLKGLRKLAPSIEKRGRGFGMSPFTAQA